jgi:hypothetical protein
MVPALDNVRTELEKVGEYYRSFMVILDSMIIDYNSVSRRQFGAKKGHCP